MLALRDVHLSQACIHQSYLLLPCQRFSGVSIFLVPENLWFSCRPFLHPSSKFRDLNLGTHSDAEHFSQKELYMAVMSSTYYEVLISVVGALLQCQLRNWLV
jgi:hypothetical protein